MAPLQPDSKSYYDCTNISGSGTSTGQCSMHFVRRFLDTNVEVDIENGYTDILAGRYVAGVRLGEEVAGDMIAVRIGPFWHIAVWLPLTISTNMVCRSLRTL